MQTDTTNSARQATEQPRQNQVTDGGGRPLRVGDRVLVRATVEALNPDGYGCNVVLRAEQDLPAAAFYGPHQSALHLHGQQCVLVERAGR